MPAVNLGLLSPQVSGRNPYLLQVEYPGIQYEYSMGPARPYRPQDPILDVIGQAASELFGEGSRVVIGSGSNIAHSGEGPDLPRHGSNRHETGTAADFTLYRPDGTVVDPMSEEGRAYALRAAELGVLGVGFGPEYMGNAYHMDLVEPGPGQGHFWASGASSMGEQLLAAMQGNTGVPGGTVASAAGRPASAPVGGGNMGRGGGAAGSTQQQERAPFGQRLRDGFRDGSMWDTLAVGLNGMTLRPDPGLQGLAGGRIADRREAQREERRLNQTAAWLRSIGRDDLASAVEAGGLSANAAGGIAFTPEPASNEPPAPQTVAWLRQNGHENLAAMVENGLITPTAAIERAMSDPDRTDDMQEYDFYVSQAQAAGEQPVDFTTWMRENRGAGATQVTVGGASEIGTIPQGYELVTDPETGARSMRPIPGGPEDRSEQIAAQEEGAAESGQIVLEDINRAMELIRENPSLTTGVIGNILGGVPGTGAADLQALIDTIGANISFEALNAMRAQSPTGGALGNVTERELTLLQATAGSIARSQSPEQLVRNLERLARQFERVVHGEGGAPAPSAFSGMGIQELLQVDTSALSLDELTEYNRRFREALDE